MIIQPFIDTLGKGERERDGERERTRERDRVRERRERGRKREDERERMPCQVLFFPHRLLGRDTLVMILY